MVSPSRHGVARLTISLFALTILSIPSVVHAANNPIPLINQPLVPDAVAPGSASFTLTVNGTSFNSVSVVEWNGKPLTTMFISDSELQVTIPASDVAVPGTATVTVSNPRPGGGISNPVYFPITFVASSVAAIRADYTVTVPETLGIATADFNRDGRLDLAVASPCNLQTCTGAGSVLVLLGIGNGSFQAPVEYATGSDSASVVIADFNGDSYPDLAVSNVVDNTVSVLIGKGDGTFQNAVSYATGNGPAWLGEADFNADGKVDLVTSNGNDLTVTVLLGNGDGTFQAPLASSAGSSPDGFAIGDFNRDGNLDLAVTESSSNQVAILSGNGAGTFGAPSLFAVGTTPTDVAAVDLNGDGLLDLAVDNVGANTESVLLGKGNGTFQTQTQFAAGNTNYSVLPADFNGDGKIDLILGSSNSSDVDVLLGNGDGTLQAPVALGTAFRPTAIVVGDFNADGRLDIATANENASTTTILLQATVSLSPANLLFPLQTVGTTSTPKIVSITNTGNSTLTFIGFTFGGTNGPDFSESSSTCGSTLSIGASCTVSVTFKPSGDFARTGILQINDTGAGSPQTVALSGIGTALSAAPKFVSFGGVKVGSSSRKSFMLTNTGTTSTKVTSIVIKGTDSGDFRQTNNCPASLGAGASCTFQVTFTPSATGARSAQVQIKSNRGNWTENLTGSGT